MDSEFDENIIDPLIIETVNAYRKNADHGALEPVTNFEEATAYERSLIYARYEKSNLWIPFTCRLSSSNGREFTYRATGLPNASKDIFVNAGNLANPFFLLLIAETFLRLNPSETDENTVNNHFWLPVEKTIEIRSLVYRYVHEYIQDEPIEISETEDTFLFSFDQLCYGMLREQNSELKRAVIAYLLSTNSYEELQAKMHKMLPSYEFPMAIDEINEFIQFGSNNVSIKDLLMGYGNITRYHHHLSRETPFKNVNNTGSYLYAVRCALYGNSSSFERNLPFFGESEEDEHKKGPTSILSSSSYIPHGKVFSPSSLSDKEVIRLPPHGLVMYLSSVQVEGNRAKSFSLIQISGLMYGVKEASQPNSNGVPSPSVMENEFYYHPMLQYATEKLQNNITNSLKDLKL